MRKRSLYSIFIRAIFLGYRAIANFLRIFKFIIQGKFKFADVVKRSLEYFKNVIAANLMIGMILGIVLGVQIGPEFISRGLGSNMGILAALVMSRELIPVVGSLMIATQYGTGFASEVANMKISDQVDALKIQQVDPVGFLVVPRFIAAILASPFIIWFSTMVAVLSTYVTIN